MNGSISVHDENSTRVASTNMKVVKRPKLTKKYVERQLVQASTSDTIEMANNIITTLPARGSIHFNLPVDALTMKIGSNDKTSTPKEQS